jgi:hypothetical protein
MTEIRLNSGHARAKAHCPQTDSSTTQGPAHAHSYLPCPWLGKNSRSKLCGFGQNEPGREGLLSCHLGQISAIEIGVLIIVFCAQMKEEDILGTGTHIRATDKQNYSTKNQSIRLPSKSSLLGCQIRGNLFKTQIITCHSLLCL